MVYHSILQKYKCRLSRYDNLGLRLGLNQLDKTPYIFKLPLISHANSKTFNAGRTIMSCYAIDPQTQADISQKLYFDSLNFITRDGSIFLVLEHGVSAIAGNNSFKLNAASASVINKKRV